MTENNSSQKKRFPLRSAFIVIAGCAVLCAIPRVMRSIYYWDLNAVESRLVSMDSISNVAVLGHDDVTYEVHGASFSLKGRPETQIKITISSAGSLANNDHLHLNSIGPWQFHVHGYGYAGAVNMKTGSKVKSKFFNGSIDIGPKGQFGHLMPCEITSIDDVIANYDRLVEFFNDWPDQTEPGVLSPDEDTLIRFYKVDKNAQQGMQQIVSD